MQPYLAIDTSTPLGSVAVGRGTDVLAELAVGVRARHAETLMPVVDFALRSIGLEAASLGGVVVAGGPGSFTGVRIAGATAKGLVRALEVPLFAYSGLLGLAASLGAEARAVCALFDARRGEVYAGCYRFPEYERIETVLEPGVRPVGEVIDAVGGGPIYAGRGAQRYRRELEAAGGVIAPAHLAWPRAAALLWLAALDPDGGRVESPSEWEPAYLRASGAERRVRG